jgi:hypothetical protein
MEVIRVGKANREQHLAQAILFSGLRKSEVEGLNNQDAE